MTVKPFGDSALLINFEQKIDAVIHQKVIALQQAIERAKIQGILYYIPAYCSLTIGYDPRQLNYNQLRNKISQLPPISNKILPSNNRKIFNIPVCYDAAYALDMEEVMQQTGLSKSEIIHLHTSITFRVYMLGFLPGFVYMGKLPPALFCQRKTTPRLKVPPQAIGIAGFQTGIYPATAPGGWQIIGQTPIKTVDETKEQPFLFQAGDRVRFHEISETVFLAMR